MNVNISFFVVLVSLDIMLMIIFFLIPSHIIVDQQEVYPGSAHPLS